MNSGSQDSSFKGTPSASTAPESTEPTECTEDTSQRRDCLRQEKVVSSRITVPPELYTRGNELVVSTSDMYRLRSLMLQNHAELVTGLSGTSTWDTTRPQVNITSESFTCKILASNHLGLTLLQVFTFSTRLMSLLCPFLHTRVAFVSALYAKLMLCYDKDWNGTLTVSMSTSLYNNIHDYEYDYIMYKNDPSIVHSRSSEGSELQSKGYSLKSISYSNLFSFGSINTQTLQMNSGSQNSSFKGTSSTSTTPESTEPTECTEDTSQRRDCLRQEKVVSSRITVPPELYTRGNELAVSTSDMYRLRSLMLQNHAELVTGLSGTSTWDTTRPQVNIASESFTCTILPSNNLGLNCFTNTAQDNLVDYYCVEEEGIQMKGVEAFSTAETTKIVT